MDSEARRASIRRARIEAVAERAMRGMSATGIAKELGLHASTIAGLLEEARELGLFSRLPPRRLSTNARLGHDAKLALERMREQEQAREEQRGGPDEAQRKAMLAECLGKALDALFPAAKGSPQVNGLMTAIARAASKMGVKPVRAIPRARERKATA